MSNEEQQQVDQEAIHRAFEHLWLCENSEAFVTLTGSRQGSGLCTALWHELKKGLATQSPVVADHLFRVEEPELWGKMDRAQRAAVSHQGPSVFVRFLHWCASRMGSQEKLSKERTEQ